MGAEVPVLVGPRGLVRITRALVVLVGVIALVSGVTTVVGGVLALVTGPLSGRWSFTLVGDHAIPSGTDHGAARMVEGSWDSATIVLTGVSGAPAVWSLIALVAGVLTPTLFCAFVVLLCWRLVRRGMFRRSRSVGVAVLGSVVAVGAVLSQGASSLASGTAAALLNGPGAHGYWPIAGRFDATWLIVGFVLALVGLAFEYGERLQRDTDGLV